jgi:hypothetical protein
MSTDREQLEAERDAVLRQLDDRTNQTWVMKRKRWATLIRDQDSVIQQLTDELAIVRAAAAIGAPQPHAAPLVALTDEQIDAVWDEWFAQRGYQTSTGKETRRKFARAIERAHGIHAQEGATQAQEGAE